MTKKKSDSNAVKLARWLADKGIDGVPPLSSSKALAREYILDKSFKSPHLKVDSLIRWETAKNFTSGFVTGLGGAITIPVSVPGALGASWLIHRPSKI